MPGSSRLLCAILLSLVVVPHQAVAGSWSRVESAHFIVSGDIGERGVRDVAITLEQFREVLLRVFPNARLNVRPLVVVAFSNEKAYRPFKPLLDGKPQPVGGYFVGNDDGGCITLQVDRGLDSFSIVFHEFAHMFLAQTGRDLPTWLKEGVAEYYSTVALVDSTQRARVGLPIAHHVRLVSERFMPLRELLATTRESAIWRDQAAVNLLYAESWALVHYLTSLQDGAARFGKLVQLLSLGRPNLAAFEEAFGPTEQVEKGLRQYTQRSIYPYWQYTFTSRIDVGQMPARPLTPAEIDATLAVPLIHLGRHDEAAARIASALAATPDLPEALAARGFLELRQGRIAVAQQTLAAAVAGQPKNLDAAFHWGLALLQWGGRDRPSLERAIVALKGVLPAEPPVDVLRVLGGLLEEVGQLQEAEASLRRAAHSAPARREIRFALAGVLAKQGRFSDARQILGPIVASGSPEEAKSARALLGTLAAAEQQAKERQELAQLSGDRSPQPTPPGGGAGDLPLGTQALRPAYRQIGPGEFRKSGLLERIECLREGMVLHLTTPEGVQRYFVARFEDMEFITYRNDLSGAVTCGARKNREPVYLTWMAAPDSVPAAVGTVAGRVVAIEFLPK